MTAASGGDPLNAESAAAAPTTSHQWPGTEAERTQVELAQAVGTYLLRTLNDACREIGVRYFLNGGTLIGALRTGGWIAWDDDIDVVMQRHDYETLAAGIGPLLPPDVMLSTPESGDHCTAVPRLVYAPSRITWIERFGMTPPERQHLALDIFIVDVAPRGERARSVWLALTRAQRMLLALRSTSAARVTHANEQWPVKVGVLGLLGVSRLLPRHLQRRAYRASATMFATREGPVVMLNSSASARTECFEQSTFECNAVSVKFEGISALGPDPGTFLVTFYGHDYLTPPPFDERRPQHLTDLWATRPGENAKVDQ